MKTNLTQKLIYLFLIFSTGLLISCSSSNKSPVGTYKFGDEGLNIENIVEIKDDGTWTLETYESGKLHEGFLSPDGGKWTLKELKLKSYEGEKVYKIICFTGNEHGYLFEDGCISALPDEIMSHSDNIYTWGEIPFGKLSNNETECKE